MTITFLQDYTTTALPPEHFEKGQEVSGRSPESELYFVKLGVAGLLVDGQLVDQDYRPIVVEKVVVVDATTDRRFGGGRGEEVIGVGAPQRASVGPGNAALFDAAAPATGPSATEVDQLRADLAASAEQYAGYGERLAGLRPDFDRTTADSMAHGEQISALDKRIAALEASAPDTGDADALAALDKRVAAIEVAASNTDASAAFEARLAALEAATKPRGR